MKPPPARGLTIRAALLLGFGLTLAVWALAGYRFTQQVAMGEARAAAISGRYVRVQAQLAAIRDDVLFIAVTLREALLEPEAAEVLSRRAQLESTWENVDAVMRDYQPVMGSPLEREGMARLQRELDGFEATMREVLAQADEDWSADQRMALRSRIDPHREGILLVSNEAQALNRRAYIEQQSGVAAAYASIQRPLWQILGAALAFTLVIAIWSTRHASRLEQRVILQAAHESRAAEELQRLSSQLLSAQEAERRTIARELHDEVGQVLTAIKMELTLAEHALRGDPDTARPFDRVRRITEGALQSVRDLSHVLHPAMLDDFGLPTAIEWYARSVSRRSGLTVHVQQEGMDARLAAVVEVTAYRIVQEGITNIVKHANAHVCRVSLVRLDDALRVTLEDDGCGFDAEARHSQLDHGLGLIGIRERVSQLGGRVELHTSPGHGTRLIVELPALARTGADDAAPVRAAQLNVETISG